MDVFHLYCISDAFDIVTMLKAKLQRHWIVSNDIINPFYNIYNSDQGLLIHGTE